MASSIDPFLDQEYEEDDDVLLSAYTGLPGTTLMPPQTHQYSSAPSSSFASIPNVYYTSNQTTTQFEVPSTSFYGSMAAQQPTVCTASMLPQQSMYSQPSSYILQHPNQTSQLVLPAYNTIQQHNRVFYLQPGQMHQPPTQQSSVIMTAPSSSSHHSQRYQFDHQQHDLMQQQLHAQVMQAPPPISTSASSSDHSYASFNDAMGLYDDGNNPSPVERQAPVLRDTPTKPMGRMVQKKRSAIEKRVGETDSASAAAVRRISTEEGWKSMNGWLKAAEQDNDKLLQLLGQCREAKVTVTLLRSNDTPKFIRKLSKNHKDEEVRTLSLSIVSRWKKIVNTPDAVEDKKEKVKKEKEQQEEEEEAAEEENQEMKIRSLPVETRRRSSDEGVTGEGADKKKEPKKDKEHRAKAKVYQSKGRSAGLFEADDGATASKKRSINETSPPTGAPAPKKSSTEKAPAAPAASTSTPIQKKPAPAPVKKVTTSSSFMDSLLSPAASAAPKRKVLPKRPIPRPDVKVTRPNAAGGEDHEGPRGVIDMLLSPNADGKVVMEGLFADTSRSLKDERSTTPPKPAASQVFVTEDPDMAVGRRKIRFADEQQGGVLVETRYFEIEEGERINVNRFTPEEMKHHEAVMEKKYIGDNSGMHDDDEDDENDDVAGNPWLMPCQTAAATAPVADTPAIRWRFVPASAEDRTEVAYGTKSQMKTIQEKRQETAMRAFFNPNVRCCNFDEPENLYEVEPEAAGANLRAHPIDIPTESVLFVEEDEGIDGVAMDEAPAVPVAVVAPQPALIPTSPIGGGQPPANDKLKGLMGLIDSLKTKGLLHDSSAAPADDPLYSMPPPPVTAVMMQPQPQPVAQPVMIPTTSTYFQEQTPQMGGGGGMNGGGFAPNRMHSIQQEFPVQQTPPPAPANMMQPPIGSAAASSGIQVVNMDVHGPGAPQTHVGPAAGGPFPPYHPGPGGRPFYVSSKPCNFFNSPRGCRFGDKCGFAHVNEQQNMNGGGGPPVGPGGFRGGVRGMRGGDFRGGPPRGAAFRGRGGPGFGGPPPQFGNNNRGGNDGPSRGDVDLRRAGGGGGGWREERRGGEDRRERRRSRSRSLSPVRRDSNRDRDYRSSRRGEEAATTDSKDVDLRHKEEPTARPPAAAAFDDDDIDGVPIEYPVEA